MSTDEEKINFAVSLLERIANDNNVPRNIRRGASEAIDMLKTGEGTHAVNASNAHDIVEPLPEDPNCPAYARTTLYKAVSLLATIRDYG